MHFEGTRQYKREESPMKPAPPDPPPAHANEMQELMLELRAAQNSKV